MTTARAAVLAALLSLTAGPVLAQDAPLMLIAQEQYVLTLDVAALQGIGAALGAFPTDGSGPGGFALLEYVKRADRELGRQIDEQAAAAGREWSAR